MDHYCLFICFVPASGSDHAGFMYTACVPSMDLGLSDDTHVYPVFEGTGYPTYHTGFETVRLVEDIVDPGFVQHRFCAQLNTYLARDFSDSLVLDFSPEEYTEVMSEGLAALSSDGVFARLDALGVDGVPAWMESVRDYGASAAAWRDRFNDTREAAGEDPLLARRLSDQV